MATDIQANIQFSDGTFAVLRKEGASQNTIESLATGGTGLNQASGIEVGVAYPGKMAVAASVQVITDSASTGSFSRAYFQGPDGKVLCNVQGGGYVTTGLPRLLKGVRMANGVTLRAVFDVAADDAAGTGCLAVYCSDGTADNFSAVGVADTKTSMTNKDGMTIGESLAGKVITHVYGTYSSTHGVNDDGAGNSGLYIEDAQGQLKLMFPPGNGRTSSSMSPITALAVGIRITQNDTLSIMTGS